MIQVKTKIFMKRLGEANFVFSRVVLTVLTV